MKRNLLLCFCLFLVISTAQAQSVSETRLTAREAFRLAKQVVEARYGDCIPVLASGTAPPGVACDGRLPVWVFHIFSQKGRKELKVKVENGKAVIAREKGMDPQEEFPPYELVLKWIENWKVDSTDVVSLSRSNGTDEFLKKNPQAMTWLNLGPHKGQGKWSFTWAWKITLMVPGKETLTVEIDGSSGQLIRKG